MGTLRGRSFREALGGLFSVSQFLVTFVALTMGAPAAFAAGGPSLSADSPLNPVLHYGDPFTLKIKATGTGTLSYQWYHDGVAIPGATSISYNVASAGDADRGMYWVNVTDDNGSAIRLVYVNTVPLKTEIFVGPKTLHLVERATTDVVNNAVQVSAAGDVISAVTYSGTVVSWTLGGSSPDILAGHAVVQAQRDGDSFPTIFLTAGGSAFSSGTPLAAVGDLVRVATFYGAAIGLKGDGTVWNLLNGQPYASSLGTACGIAIAGNAPMSPSAGVGDTAFLVALHPDGTYAAVGFNGGQTPTLAHGPLLKSVTGCNDTIWAITRSDEAYLIFSGSSNYSGLIPNGGNIRGVAGPNILLHKDGTAEPVYLWTLVASNFHRHEMEPIDVTQAFALEGKVARSFASITCVGLRDATADAIPVFTTQPDAAQVAEGADLVLHSGVDSGTAEVTYQWFKDGVAVAGATTESLHLPDSLPSDAGSYYVEATDRLGKATSTSATVVVSPLLPTLTMTYPKHRYVSAGEVLSLGVSAAGTGALTYEWALNGAVIAGAKSSTYETTITGLADTGLYTVTVTDSVGKRTGVMPIRWTPGWTSVVRIPNPDVPPTGEPVSFATVHDVVAFVGRPNPGALLNRGLVLPASVGWVANTRFPSDLYDVVEPLTLSWSGRAQQSLTTLANDVVAGVNLGGYQTTLALLKSDGTLVEQDLNIDRDSKAAKVPHGIRDVVDIKGKGGHILILKADGTVVALADADSTLRAVPAGLSGVKSIFVTAGADYAVKFDGSVIGWDHLGTLSLPGSWTNVARICESDDTLAIKDDGTVVGLGGSLKPSPTIGYTGVLDIVQDRYSAESLLLLDKSAERPPVLASGPEGLTQTSGSSGSLSVTLASTGSSVPTFQWYKNGVAISGATSSSLSLNSLSAGDAGSYTVVVSNTFGSFTPRPALVTVAQPVPSRLFNISVRGTVYANQKLIMGFVVTGESRKLLVRGIGPSLVDFGLGYLNEDTLLTVHHSLEGVDSIVASNDDWGFGGEAARLSQVFASVGAFALSNVNSLDAALVYPASGTNTVVVDVKDPFYVNTYGSPALAEVYDTEMDDASRLINFSARNYVGRTGFRLLNFSPMIAGFAINGNVPKKVLIRAVGPSLSAFGVAAPLSDPKLELHTTIAGVDSIIATNDDWVTEVGAAKAFADAGAFPLADFSRDAAVVYELPPGTYTAVVTTGVAFAQNGVSGDALVEVYEIPDPK